MLLVVYTLASTVTGSVQRRDPEVELEHIVQLLAVAEGKVVADVGAGGGFYAFGLADRVGPRGRVYATEVKTPQVDGLRAGARAKRLENVEVIHGSQEDMGLPANCCDALLLRLVYHAFDDPVRMRESMRSAMKTGGLILIVDFRPAPEQLTAEMNEAGFDRVQFIQRWQEQDGVFAVLFRKRRP